VGELWAFARGLLPDYRPSRADLHLISTGFGSDPQPLALILPHRKA
jgi:hypothetical protein